MSDSYSSLLLSPKKKRYPPVSDDDDESIITPKKVRAQPRTPVSRRRPVTPASLPHHLVKLQAIQTSLHHALAHALATSAVSPKSDTGLVPNVLNHNNLVPAAGFGTSCSLEELRQLCWLWEWDGISLPSAKNASDDADDNPFIDKPAPENPKQWTRGSMGLIITPTSHLSKSSGKRVPAYGVGIEVEMDIDKGMLGGMAAVARWTGDGEHRMKDLKAKLQKWCELHEDEPTVPRIPMADLPSLVQPITKQSSLTQRLASLSPKSPKSFGTSASAPIQAPPSPSGVSFDRILRTPTSRAAKDSKLTLPLTPASLPRVKSSIAFPATPSSSREQTGHDISLPPATDGSKALSRPETPTHQKGIAADTAPQTPSTSRRAALYDRIRKRSETQPSTPSKKAKITAKIGMTKDQLLKLGQEEIRRRCLLGRLGGVAESIWMLFATPAPSSTSTPSRRKRRTLPSSEVIHSIVQSSPVPISAAEARESIDLLISLCPFFLKWIEVGTEEWLEMPASNMPESGTNSPDKSAPLDDTRELKSLSPKRVKKEAQGLREVRERIKRELEAD